MKKIILIILILLPKYYLFQGDEAFHLNIFQQHSYLIALENDGFGSGFIFQNEKGRFLITARHVIYKNNENELNSSSCQIFRFNRDEGNTYHYLSLDLTNLEKQGLIKSYKVADVCAIQILKNQAPYFNKGVKSFSSKPSVVLGSINVQKFKDTDVGKDIYIVGYPISLYMQDTSQIDMTYPLMKKGILAGKNKFENTLILDCSVFGGNSGGPVIIANQLKDGRVEYKLIGIITQFIPFEQKWINNKIKGLVNTEISNSGYSVATPFEICQQLIARFE